MVAFYNAKDRAIYDAGDKFMSQSKYLQNDYVPTEGISYEGDGSPVSYANSMGGIMTQAPIIYPPIINQGGGDGPPGPGPTDYGYKSIADNPNATPVDQAQTNFEYDIGEGTVAKEDDEKTKGLSIMDMVRAGGAYMVGGPLNAISSLNKTNKRNKQKEIDKINAEIEAQYGPNDPGLRGNDGTPGFGITAQGYHTNQFDGGDPGQAGFDTGGGKEMMARGGRAGYFFGGRVNYKAGGRTDAGANRSTASKAGVGQINEAGNKVDGGNYSNNNDGSGGIKPTFYGKDNSIITTDFISQKPNITINYADPKNFASLYSKIGFNNLIDNDNIEAKANVMGKAGPVNYNASLTEKGLKGIDLTAGNFGANLNSDMQLQNIGYTNNYKGIDYGVNTDFDNTMFTAGVNFKNGGLAGLL